MQWQDIRQRYPQQWLLLEAVNAHSHEDARVVDQLDVIGSFSDSASALKTYAKLHHDAPQREFYVFHTSREALEIHERRWIGIRGVR